MTIASDIADGVLAKRNMRRRIPTYREFSATLAIPPALKRGDRYNPESDPCQSYLISQMDAGGWDRIYVCAPPQWGGKTQVAVLTPTLRKCILERLSVGYGLPTLQDLDKAWEQKLKPALMKSGYQKHLPSKGPGARGGRGPTLQFYDPESGEAEGMIVFLAGGAYGDTVATAIVDEVDQFRTSDGAPLWGALEDIFNRANAYGRRALRIAVGTIEHDTQSIILVLIIDHGTGTRPWLRCPTCSRHQVFDLSQFTYDGADETTARTTARITCQHCPAAWDEDARQRAIRGAVFAHKTQTVGVGGVITGTLPRTRSLGLIWTAFDSTLADLGEIAAEHWRATQALVTKREHGLMRKWYRYRACQVYTKDTDEDGAPAQLSVTYLVSRSQGSDYDIIDRSREQDGDSVTTTKPPEQGPAFLTAFCDVQQGDRRAPPRLYFLMLAGATDLRLWDVAWGSLALAKIGEWAALPELHAGLDRLHALWNELATRFGRPLVRRGVDVGDRQDEIRRWQARHHDWWAMKGGPPGLKADDAFDIPQWIYRQPQDGGWTLYQVPKHYVRQEAQAGLMVPAGKPGAHHLPSGMDGNAALIKHYCATALIPDGHGGLRWSDKKADRKHHPDWQERHDYLDCRVGAHALMYQYVRTLTRRAPVRKYGLITTLGNDKP